MAAAPVASAKRKALLRTEGDNLIAQARLSIESEVGTGSVFACHFGPDRVQPRQEDPLALPAAGQPTC